MFSHCFSSLNIEAIVSVSSPPLSFDILTSAWAQRETKGEGDRESEGEDYRYREEHRKRAREGNRPLKGTEYRTWLENRKIEAL